MATFRSYCVREKRFTDCVPGSEIVEFAKNGREMVKCKCASCGATKTTFLPKVPGYELDPKYEEALVGPIRSKPKTMLRDYHKLTGERLFLKHLRTEKRKKIERAKAEKILSSRHSKNVLEYLKTRGAEQDELISDQDRRYRELTGEDIWKPKKLKDSWESRFYDLVGRSGIEFEPRVSKIAPSLQKKRKPKTTKVTDKFWLNPPEFNMRIKAYKPSLKIADRFNLVPPQYKMLTYDPSYQKQKKKTAETKAIVRRIADEIRDYEKMYERAFNMGANRNQLNMINKEIENLQHSMRRALLLG